MKDIKNNIDKNFMILWSNYLLDEKMNMDKLTALAELGQLDAIQAYYLMSETKNSKIDKIVNSLPMNEDPNNDYTRNCKYYFEHKNEIDKKVKDAGVLYRKLEHDLFKYKAWLYVSSSIASLAEELHEVPYFNEKINCAKRMWKQGKMENDPTTLESAVEIQSKVPLCNAFMLNACAKSTRRKLKKACKEEPENLIYKFNLAKNLINFNSSEKNKTIAKRLLTDVLLNTFESDLSNLNAENHVAEKGE